MDKEIKNSIDFINQKVGKQNGFSIPENYLEGIEEDILNSIKAESFPKQNNFKTPENYFKGIEDDIFNKLNITEKPKETKIISLRRKVIRFVPIAAAASVLLFIGLNYFNTSNHNISIDDITEADLTAWYENGYGDTDNEDLVLAFNNTDLESDTFDNISNENLEDYLNDIDSSTYLNEIQ